MKEVPLMFCFDRNYVIPASVAFYSLLRHNGGGAGHSKEQRESIQFKLFVVHNDISQAQQDKLHLTIKPFSNFASLQFINAKNYLQELWKNYPNQYHFSYEMLYKLIAPSLFPQYDKIIISDVDVVFLGDVSKSFFDFDISKDDLIGGVVSNNPQDFLPLPKKGWQSRYKNFDPDELEAIQYGIAAGYLIVNLKQWREEKIEQKALKYLQNNAHKLVLAEQDILGIVSHKRIKKISPAHIVAHTSWIDLGHSWEKFKPNIYTQEEIIQARDYPIQLHYVGVKKPWNSPNEPKSDLWFFYLSQTPFLEEYLAQFESIMFEKFKKSRFIYRALRFIKKHLFSFFGIQQTRT